METKVHIHNPFLLYPWHPSLGHCIPISNALMPFSQGNSAEKEEIALLRQECVGDKLVMFNSYSKVIYHLKLARWA